MRGAIFCRVSLRDLVRGYVWCLFGVSVPMLFLEFRVFIFFGSVRGGVCYVVLLTNQYGSYFCSMLCWFFGILVWRLCIPPFHYCYFALAMAYLGGGFLYRYLSFLRCSGVDRVWEDVFAVF